LKTIPTGEYTLRSFPPQLAQTVSASSVNFWTTSVRSPHSVQAYWYVGTVSSLIAVPRPRAALALAAVNC
jgi:hypothetical protein